MISKTHIDRRGRLVIPKELREKLDLKPGQSVLIECRNGEILMKPFLKAEEFAAELRGCVRGSRIKPSKIKEIWGAGHR